MVPQNKKKNSGVKAGSQCHACAYSIAASEGLKGLACIQCGGVYCSSCLCAFQLPVGPNLGLDTLRFFQHRVGSWKCPICSGIDNYDKVLLDQADAVVRSLKQLSGCLELFCQFFVDVVAECAWGCVERLKPSVFELLTSQCADHLPPSIDPQQALELLQLASTKQHRDLLFLSIPIETSKHMGGKRVSFGQANSTKEMQVLTVAFLSQNLNGEHPTNSLLQGVISQIRPSKVTRLEFLLVSLYDEDEATDPFPLWAQSNENVRAVAIPTKKTTGSKKVNSQIHDAFVVEQLRSLKMDIAIDLDGHIAKNNKKYMADGVARCQIWWLGSAVSSGSQKIYDAIIYDGGVVPSPTESLTESILMEMTWYQSNSIFHLYNGLTYDLSSQPNRGMYGLREQDFIFANFGQLGRISQDLFQQWLQILSRVPNSKLVLVSHCKFAACRLLREAARGGISAERIIFVPYTTSKNEHLMRMSILANLQLDTPGYGQHTNLTDAFGMAKLMITRRGHCWPSLVASSLYELLGPDLSEHLVAESPEQYVELAVRLALDRPKLQELTQVFALRVAAHPMLNPFNWLLELEAGLWSVWRSLDDIAGPDKVVVKCAEELAKRGERVTPESSDWIFLRHSDIVHDSMHVQGSQTMASSPWFGTLTGLLMSGCGQQMESVAVQVKVTRTEANGQCGFAAFVETLSTSMKDQSFQLAFKERNSEVFSCLNRWAKLDASGFRNDIIRWARESCNQDKYPQKSLDELADVVSEAELFNQSALNLIDIILHGVVGIHTITVIFPVQDHPGSIKLKSDKHQRMLHMFLVLEARDVMAISGSNRFNATTIELLNGKSRGLAFHEELQAFSKNGLPPGWPSRQSMHSRREGNGGQDVDMGGNADRQSMHSRQEENGGQDVDMEPTGSRETHTASVFVRQGGNGVLTSEPTLEPVDIAVGSRVKAPFLVAPGRGVEQWFSGTVTRRNVGALTVTFDDHDEQQYDCLGDRAEVCYDPAVNLATVHESNVMLRLLRLIPEEAWVAVSGSGMGFPNNDSGFSRDAVARLQSLLCSGEHHADAGLKGQVSQVLSRMLQSVCVAEHTCEQV